MKKEKAIKILQILKVWVWPGLSGLFILQSVFWLMALTFVAYPKIVEVFMSLESGESVLPGGQWVAQHLFEWGPFAYLMTGLCWAVYVGVKGLRRLRE